MILDDNRIPDKHQQIDQIFILYSVIAVFICLFLLVQPWRSVENWFKYVIYGALVDNTVSVFYLLMEYKNKWKKLP